VGPTEGWRQRLRAAGQLQLIAVGPESIADRVPGAAATNQWPMQAAQAQTRLRRGEGWEWEDSLCAALLRRVEQVKQ
jgi:hypothetical protein